MIIDNDGAFLYKEKYEFDYVIGDGITNFYESNNHFEFYVYTDNILIKEDE